MEVRPLSGAFGVELVGVDLRDEQPPEVQDAARTALRDRLLVLVRGQPLELDDQVRFASWFGPVTTRGTSFTEDSPEMYISNTRPQGVAREGSLLKHQDHCFLDVVLPAICLYAEAVCETGGETVFADAHAAYQRVPQSVRARLAGLSARHVYDHAEDSGTTRFRVASASPAAQQAVHPVVWPHPDTGRPILFVNELMTDSICGWPDDASEELLATLWSYLDDPDVTYVHRWEVGDVVIWDNRSLQHGRRPFPPGSRRSLRRLQVG
jgi:taurine dioxygenase